jgi:hypothetical protein
MESETMRRLGAHLQDCYESIKGMRSLSEVFDNKSEHRGTQNDVWLEVEVKVDL